MNSVILVGYLGNEPVTRQVNNSNVTNLSLATHSRYNDKNGETQTITSWHRIECWGPISNSCNGLKKGDRVMIRGQIKYSNIDVGEKTYSLARIRASNVERIINTQNNNSQQQPSQQENSQQQTDQRVAEDGLAF